MITSVIIVGQLGCLHIINLLSKQDFNHMKIIQTDPPWGHLCNRMIKPETSITSHLATEINIHFDCFTVVRLFKTNDVVS